MHVKRPRSQPVVATSTCQHEQRQGMEDHLHVHFRELVESFDIHAPLLMSFILGVSFRF